MYKVSIDRQTPHLTVAYLTPASVLREALAASEQENSGADPFASISA